MQARQIVGIVLGSAGVLISLGNLVLMIIFRTREPYRGFVSWVVLGLGMAVVGLLLLLEDETR